jgi:septum site-determining protein MinC
MKRSRRSSRRRTGRTTRSPNLSTLCKGELVAFVSELEAQKKLASQSAPDQISADAAAEPALHRVPKAPVPCLFVEEAVRSGQVIDFPGGDVVVIGAVGSGAEIVAGGSIHVYGTVRGRALAGAGGDRTARIFCRGFQAELLSIAGMYRLAENIDQSLRGRSVQARLDGMEMSLLPLD